MPDRASRSPQFATTRWSIVAAAGDGNAAGQRAALGQLIESYWYPLYAFARRRGQSAGDAEDLIQAFLTDLIERNAFAAADRSRGRFRSFLLAGLQHFIANARDHDRALKRGGGRRALTLDFAAAESRYSREPAHDLTPEKLFERKWALELLHLVLESLEHEYKQAGKAALFEALKPTLAQTGPNAPYAEIAADLHTTPEAIKTAAHRLRRRYRDLIRRHIADTVASPADIDDELRHLFAALA